MYAMAGATPGRRLPSQLTPVPNHRVPHPDPIFLKPGLHDRAKIVVVFVDSHVFCRCLLVVYRVTVSARTAARLLLWLADGLELSRTISGIQMLLWTTSSACWKRFCYQPSAINALDVLRRCARQNSHFTYLLTLSRRTSSAEQLRQWLSGIGLGFDCGSNTVRLPFDSNSTALYDHSTTYVRPSVYLTV